MGGQTLRYTPLRSDFDVTLGRALRRWRILHQVKQSDAAERLGVTQSTISRWEAGTQEMDGAQRSRLEALVAARLDVAADRVLGSLVSNNRLAMHLICDRTHRLLACSTMRAASFGIDWKNLVGRSLLRFSPEPILEEEARLPVRGWHDLPMPEPVEFETGSNSSRVVPIHTSLCRWTRLLLSDGAAVRLVETL